MINQFNKKKIKSNEKMNISMTNKPLILKNDYQDHNTTKN